MRIGTEQLERRKIHIEKCEKLCRQSRNKNCSGKKPKIARKHLESRRSTTLAKTFTDGAQFHDRISNILLERVITDTEHVMRDKCSKGNIDQPVMNRIVMKEKDVLTDLFTCIFA